MFQARGSLALVARGDSWFRGVGLSEQGRGVLACLRTSTWPRNFFTESSMLQFALSSAALAMCPVRYIRIIFPL